MGGASFMYEPMPLFWVGSFTFPHDPRLYSLAAGLLAKGFLLIFCKYAEKQLPMGRVSTCGGPNFVLFYFFFVFNFFSRSPLLYIISDYT